MYRFYIIILCIVVLCSGCSLWARMKRVMGVDDNTIQEETLYKEAESGPVAEALSELDSDIHKEESNKSNDVFDKKTKANLSDVEKDTQAVLDRHPPSSSSEVPSKKKTDSYEKQFPQSQEEKMYKDALQLYELHRYSESIKYFDQFMGKYSNSRLMPNALYWKAENLYAQHKFADAIFIFKSVTATYPKHQKAADALLKAGMSYKALGDQDNATLHFRALYEDYPKSTAAQHAQKLGIKP